MAWQLIRPALYGRSAAALTDFSVTVLAPHIQAFLRFLKERFGPEA